jgi:hypothetical protein
MNVYMTTKSKKMKRTNFHASGAQAIEEQLGGRGICLHDDASKN